MDEQVERYLTKVRDVSKEWARAKGEMVMLENNKHVVMANLWERYKDGKTVRDREMLVYCDPEFDTWAKGYAAAVTLEAELRWKLKCAEWKVDLFRTQEATRRQEMKMTPLVRP